MKRTAALLTGLIIIGFAFLVRAHPASIASDTQSSRVTGSSMLQAQAPTVSGAIVPVSIPIPSPEAVHFYQSGNVLWIVSTLWGVLVPALILFTGFSARLRDWAKRIGHTKRIVLWDTIIKQSTANELSVVMSHEMGHYVLGHVWSGLIFGSSVLLVGLWLVHRCAGWILRRFAARTGVTELGDIASLPLLMLIFGLFIFAFKPALLAYSRHLEHEADRFALEITRDNHDCATAFVKFIQHDLAYPTPGPLFVLWRSSHPPLAERISFCNTYRPWLEGQIGRYSKYFSPPVSDVELK
jgi:hypothetical protein